MSTPLTEADAAIIAGLQKPGAGIPLVERLALRLYFKPFVAGRAGWEQDVADFAAANDKIFKTLDGLTPEQLERRILVPKQQGLEDSSRYSSAAMTLEHLMIVGMSMRNIIAALSHGIVPDYKADTASVKPAGAGDAAATLGAYRDFAAHVMLDIDRSTGDRNSKTTFDHPWFGAFTARQWHWLLPVHTFIHLKQLRAIAASLKAPQ